MRYAPLSLVCLLALSGVTAKAQEPTQSLGIKPHISAAEAVVQKQVLAYNRGDANAFAETYAVDAKLYSIDSPYPYMEGREAIREQYTWVFQTYPNLKCKIVNRMVVDGAVVDHEMITGTDSPSPYVAIAIYEVKNGLITRVWFAPPAPTE